MLVMVLDDQIITPRVVCQSCLLADQGGQPRWSENHLRCGKAVGQHTEQLPDQYQCTMGFQVLNISQG
jgi:hypothetical protein